MWVQDVHHLTENFRLYDRRSHRAQFGADVTPTNLRRFDSALRSTMAHATIADKASNNGNSQANPLAFTFPSII